MKYALLIILTLFIAGCGIKDKKADTAEKVLYTCPMHPQIIQDHPGICPICHMDLVVKATGGKEDTSGKLDSTIDLSQNELLLANLKTITIKSQPLNNEIKAYSTITSAEDNKRTISARFGGRIERLFANKVGLFIQKGSPLFEIYSPEIIQAQNDFIISQGNENLNSSAKEKLLLFGITEKQIQELKNSNKVINKIIYYSPYSGTIVDKKVQEGMYVSEGSSMFELADFSTLWNLADIYENDINLIKNGMNVTFTLQSFPGERFVGKVDIIYPIIDPSNRTVKVRSVILNKSGKLRPNMFGESVFEVSKRHGISIPAEAILMTGNRNIVYIKVSKGKFLARDIKLGKKSGENYEVLSGLNENEEIAYSGNYLLDSEAQLRGIINN